jgi:hypothetical protein
MTLAMRCGIVRCGEVPVVRIGLGDRSKKAAQKPRGKMASRQGDLDFTLVATGACHLIVNCLFGREMRPE